MAARYALLLWIAGLIAVAVAADLADEGAIRWEDYPSWPIAASLYVLATLVVWGIVGLLASLVTRNGRVRSVLRLLAAFVTIFLVHAAFHGVERERPYLHLAGRIDTWIGGLAVLSFFVLTWWRHHIGRGICNRCAYPVVPGQRRCPECGRRYRESQLTAAPGQAATPSPPPPAPDPCTSPARSPGPPP